MFSKKKHLILSNFSFTVPSINIRNNISKHEITKRSTNSQPPPPSTKSTYAHVNPTERPTFSGTSFTKIITIGPETPDTQKKQKQKQRPMTNLMPIKGRSNAQKKKLLTKIKREPKQVSKKTHGFVPARF